MRPLIGYLEYIAVAVSPKKRYLEAEMRGYNFPSDHTTILKNAKNKEKYKINENSMDIKKLKHLYCTPSVILKYRNIFRKYIVIIS